MRANAAVSEVMAATAALSARLERASWLIGGAGAPLETAAARRLMESVVILSQAPNAEFV